MRFLLCEFNLQLEGGRNPKLELNSGLYSYRASNCRLKHSLCLSGNMGHVNPLCTSRRYLQTKGILLRLGLGHRLTMKLK